MRRGWTAAWSVLLVMLGLLTSAEARRSPRHPPSIALGFLAKNLKAFDGKIVRTRGWVDECPGYDCRLVSAAYPVLASSSHTADKLGERRDQRIGLPFGNGLIDVWAPKVRGAEVTVDVKINADCFLDGLPMCKDYRPSTLNLVRVVRIHRYRRLATE